MNRIAIVIAIITISLSSAISAQQIATIVFPEQKITAKIPTLPAGVTNYKCIAYVYTTRDQAIKTNKFYTDKVIKTMSDLALLPCDRTIAKEFAKFYANPTSDDCHFRQALEMVNLSYHDGHDLALYIIEMYNTSDLNTTAIANAE